MGTQMNGDKLGIIGILICALGMVGAGKIMSMIHAQDPNFLSLTSIAISLLLFVGVVAFLIVVRKVK